MSSLAPAVVLSLVSAVAYAAGAIMQEHVAASTSARPYAPLHHAAWWVAVALNGLGAVLHVLALAYGPLSLVQPLGALTIVFALPMAALFVRRRAGAAAWRGALMATVGLAGLLALTGTAASHSLDGGQRAMLAGATFGGVALLFLVAQTVHRPIIRSVLLAASAGVAFGIASVFTKTVAVDWSWSAPAAQWPSLLVIAVLACGGLLLSQASYRGAGLAAPLATVTVVNPVVAAAVGITMFGESFRYGLTGTVFALGFGALAAGGLILLTTERLAAARAAAQAQLHAEAQAHMRPSQRPVHSAEPGEARAGHPESEGRHADPQARVSERDATRPEVGDGIDVGPVSGAGADLEMEMRSRAVSGRS
ncbi:DMT family transporter [Streptomyces sp. NPDC019890]|uniref:DMT family transporter n=1 Tax=Streptomyces sp. NPDC019890 TaxID=3365064 RepID=UPI00384D5B8A